MTADELRALVLRELGRIAPEAEAAKLPDDAVLQDELDLDSMDLLNLAARLEQTLGVRIPESDYAQLRTLRSAIAFLARALAARPA
jgi:acyl carrier protein